MILTLIALLVLVALPLYLWRHPKPRGPIPVDAGAAQPVDAGAPEDAAPPPPDGGAAAFGGRKATLSDPKIVRCAPATGGRVTPDRCDRIAWFEDALVRAIRENVACAPQTPASYTVSFVLTVDFAHKKTHVWAGKSGTLRKHGAAELLRCVERALPAPEWERGVHQYARYEINVVASYQSTTPAPPPLP
jgi:hypothetical protein